MPAVTLAQQCRFRHVLRCACLIVLLGLSLGSSPTLVTAQDEPARDGIAPLPEGAQQAEFELAMPVPVAEYVDPVGPSERPREAVVEVSVEVPLDDGAVAEHDVSDAPHADAEEQRVIEEARMAEASLEAAETRRDVQAEREEDRRLEENERTAAEAQSPSEEAAAQKAVETQRSVEAAMEEEPFPSTVRVSAEENGAQPSGSGAFHSEDLAQEAAVHHDEQLPPPADSVMEVEPSSSTGTATLDTHLPTKEKGNKHMAEETKRAEAQIAAEAQQADTAPHLEEMPKAAEASAAEEAKQLGETRVVQESQKKEQVRIAEEAARQAEEAARQAEAALQAEEAQKDEKERLAEERRKGEEARLAREAQRADAQRAEEEARRAETRRKAEEKRQVDAAEAQRRLNTERKPVLAKIDEERVRFRTAASDLITQQEVEKSSAARRDRAVATELQKSMEKKLEALQQDLVTLGRVSVTLRGRVSALLHSSTLTQVQEDAQALDEVVVKAGETLDSIREAADSLADAARAAVGNEKDAPATTAEKITLLAKQKMALETARDAAIQHFLERLQAIDSQLVEAAEQTETEETAVAGPAEAAEGLATPPLSPVAPAGVEAPQEVVSLPSEAPRPVGTSTHAPTPSAPRAEPRVNSPKHAEESHSRYRGELSETPANRGGEEGYSESSYEAYHREGGAPYKVKRHMEIAGTVVVITIAATVQTLRWCRSGCRCGEEEDEETSEDVTPELQARETSLASPQMSPPQSGGPLQQRPQASPPSTLRPRGANAGPDRNGMELPSRWESGNIPPPSQRGTPSASSEQMRLPAEEGDILSPTPVLRHHPDAFPLGAPVPGRPGVTRRPPHGTPPLDTARAPPPPGTTSPFTPSRNEALGISLTPTQRQLPLPGGQFGGPSSPPLSGHPSMAGTPLQMHRRRSNGDDFELRNPFLSRWS
ncbi:conserved hypothetical protein [Leishmania infantum JPCM5]|uniref:Uncharacterized protein n=2 Tax=Leishmania infantum TaxID=5671 RepID=A4IAC3_LEIIN|nr:conserved hypothetical protein [Leishmania infantum JPCM5]CAC9540836.1 hypothetical_protein_-_conserved [Leishmania infantum]CAM71780.1 conserved hypothetical protein [Leishmania infantum JPCM5]SUZ45735.1 hypothetical_protein_-_conserved [Leishmania infantum]|eukprot:XP_001468692.1 conserved hypothetical protein [Leishmania infantum JPCM5]